jgi:hypothetical protein
MSARHSLDANREHGRDDRGQSFRNRRDRQRHSEDEHVEQRRGTVHVFHENDRHDHDQRDGDHHQAQHLAGAIELPLKRRRLVGRFLQKSGDATGFGAHPGSGDNRLAVPVGSGSATEHHVVSIRERHFFGNRSRVLADRKALAGQRGFGSLEGGRFNQTCISWNGVAFFNKNDVAGDEFGGANRPPLALANGRGVGGRHRAKGGDRCLRSRFLDVTHGRVQEDDREDGNRFIGQRFFALERPEPGGHRGSDEEQDDEHILKLREKPPPGRDRRFGGQLVRSKTFEPYSRVRGGQASSLVRGQRSDDIVNAQTVRTTRVWRFAHDGGHLICSLKRGTPSPRMLPHARRCEPAATMHSSSVEFKGRW